MNTLYSVGCKEKGFIQLVLLNERSVFSCLKRKGSIQLVMLEYIQLSEQQGSQSACVKVQCIQLAVKRRAPACDASVQCIHQALFEEQSLT